MPYNVTSFNKTTASDYLASVNKAADGLPVTAFMLVVGVISAVVIQRTGYGWDNAFIGSGFITALIGFILFTAGVASADFVFTPVAMVIIGGVVKALTE